MSGHRAAAAVTNSALDCSRYLDGNQLTKLDVGLLEGLTSLVIL
jgi:hypothetical protein